MLLIVGLTSSIGCGTGCDQLQPTVDRPQTQPDPIADSGDVGWPYWPVSMSIHALTRITIDRGENAPVLEARVEFTDAEGATTKATGQVLLELTDDVAFADAAPASEVWSIDLRALRKNATHFDEVTRTYLFKLRLKPEQQWHRPRLRVQFQGADGAVLTDRSSVRPYVIDAGQDDKTPGDVLSDEPDAVNPAHADALPAD